MSLKLLYITSRDFAWARRGMPPLAKPQVNYFYNQEMEWASVVTPGIMGYIKRILNGNFSAPVTLNTYMHWLK